MTTFRNFYPRIHPNGYVQDCATTGLPVRIAQPFIPQHWAAPTYQETDEERGEMQRLALQRAVILTRHVTADVSRHGIKELHEAARELREATLQLEAQLQKGRVVPLQVQE